MAIQLQRIDQIAESVRQGGNLTRLRDEAGARFPVIQVSNLEPSGLAPSEFPLEILNPDKVNTLRAKAGQVLLSLFTSKLRAAIVTADVERAGAVIGTNVAVVTPDVNVVDATYLLALFSSRGFHARLERLTGGSTIAQVSVTTIRNLDVPVPRLDRQRALGAAFLLAVEAEAAAKRITKAQRDLMEHATLDLWDEAEAGGGYG